MKTKRFHSSANISYVHHKLIYTCRTARRLTKIKSLYIHIDIPTKTVIDFYVLFIPLQ